MIASVSLYILNMMKTSIAMGMATHSVSSASALTFLQYWVLVFI